ncbi:GPI-anchored protein LLG1 [Heracleum sosnowskyi]|uniref:GPI-anchored protein LLG1 n=1 Tax=Heracleum sosnowskyi TaxID=360622 RepID=A0AAD8M7Y8_9APIA|nr:GPI-anchored protein LLG1 [Heracleum sosnowskyi]
MEAANCVSSCSYFKILFVSISLLVHFSTSTFISDGIFESPASTGRNLLQAKQDCPVDFESKNYTIITSQCKGPNYQPKPCCDSLKEFACPYTDELNDLSNTCSDTMFSYITRKGNYPPGLFSSFCREGKEGLDCSSYIPPDSAKDASGGNTRNPFQLLMLTTACLITSAF